MKIIKPNLYGALLFVQLTVFVGCATPYDMAAPKPPETIEGHGVLVFSKIAGYRHASIVDGVNALKLLGAENGWTVVDTKNGAAFNDAYLSHFDVVVWLNTTRDVLNSSQETAFQQYVEAGGGYVGIHAAADTEYDWAWYGETLLGARFSHHPNLPNVRKATVVVETTDHPATAPLPARWIREDEWYNFDGNPRNNAAIQVLASLDENTYDPGKGAMGDHPIVWCQDIGKGRAIYTGLGHTPESYADEVFRAHLVGAIQWAGGFAD